MHTRGKIAVGAAIAILAGEMIGQPPLWVSLPLLCFGLFLLVWGLAPIQTRNLFKVLPASCHIDNILDGLDSFLEKTGIEDTECLNKLSHKMDDGLKLLNLPVKTEQEFETWKIDSNNWTNAVFDEIEASFGRHRAVPFRSVVAVKEAIMPPFFNSDHNALKLHLEKRINNLKSFLES